MNKLVGFIICSIILSGCIASQIDKGVLYKIEAWQKQYPNRKGDCGIIAIKRCGYYESKGIESKMILGRFKRLPHAWCEYYDTKTGKWLIDDPAIWYINKGYPREAYKTNGINDYVEN